VRVYADRAYLPEGARYVELLYPLWGLPPEDPADPRRGRYDRYAADGSRIVQAAPLADSDLAVFPAKWEDVNGDAAGVALAQELVAAAAAYGKPAAVFFWSDSAEPVPVEGALVFRTSLSASGRRPGEHAMPAWSEDFVERYLGGELVVRARGPRPVVGFCGYVPRPSLVGRLRGVGSGHSVRRRALSALGASPAVETCFVLRDRFNTGSREEYVATVVGSDYTLCTRGAGNFSYRLYETMSCGRIPVFVDTDCVLPYEDAIDWRSLCVWVDERDVSRIDESVAAFHERLSPAEFEERQRQCRAVWERWLSPSGFFANLARCLP
jgi:hypothetical protein